MKNKTTVPVPQALDTNISYLIWRQQLNTRFRTLDPDEAVVLSIAAKQASFAELCDTLAQWYATDEIALRAASLLKAWLTEGLISSLSD
jgi:hypothetical protein